MSRSYRRARLPAGGAVYTVRYQQTDLWIWSERERLHDARRALLEARMRLERYAALHPGFLTDHLSRAVDPSAPDIVRTMMEGARAAGVGPMAAVAGAIAQYVGERILEKDAQVIVENGGDCYLKADRYLTVGVLAGDSPLSDRVGIRVAPADMPLGIGTSSASVGHSWSYGRADAACVVAGHAALADAAATALCNRINGPSDLRPALDWVLNIRGVRGAVVIVGKTLAAKGSVDMVSLDDRRQRPAEA